MKVRVKQKVKAVLGDTHTIEYKPDYLSSIDTKRTIKVYRANGGIDPSAPPVPSDAAWVEITDQSVLDDLKSQNEYPITDPNYTGRTATVNVGGTSVTLQAQSASLPALRDDYKNKVKDNFSNPNMAFSTGNNAGRTTLLAPGNSYFYEFGDGGYTNIANQDSSNVVMISENVLGGIPQVLLKWNAITDYEQKYGAIPGLTLAEKIEWWKANVKEVKGVVYARGECSGSGANDVEGKLVYFSYWDTTVNDWRGKVRDGYGTDKSDFFSTSATIDDLGIVLNSATTLPRLIDANGYVYFLVHTDAASSTNDIVLSLTAHGFNNNDLAYNTTRSRWFGVTKITNDCVNAAAVITGQTVGDTIEKYHKSTQFTAETGSTTTTIIKASHGLVTGDAIANSTRGFQFRKVTKIDDNTFTISPLITDQVVGDTIVTYKYYGTQTAESTVIPSTIYVDSASIDIQMKAPANYDLMVASNPRRDSGFSPSVLLEKTPVNISGSGYPSAGLAGKTATNKVTNGNFADLTGWSPNNVTATVSNNEVTIVANSTNSEHYLEQSTIVPTSGHKYYVKCYLKNFVGSKGTVTLYNKKSDGTYESASGTTLSSAGYSSLIFTTSSVHATAPVMLLRGRIIRASDTTNVYAGTNEAVTISQMMTIDLTEVFGAGTEPTQAQADVMFATWFNGSAKLLADKATLYGTNNSVEVENITSGKVPAMMVEFDMSPVASGLGKDNAGVEGLIKGLLGEFWASGSGANNGQVAYGVGLNIWASDASGYSTANKWVGSVIGYSGIWKNTTTSISKMYTGISTTYGVFVTPANKIYFMVMGLYPSDGTIPSSLSLDYFNVKVDLTRTPDVISNPPRVYLQNNWTLILQGFSPIFASANMPLYRRLFDLGTDDNNKIGAYTDVNGWQPYMKVDGAVHLAGILTAPYLKNQICNFAIRYDCVNLVMFALVNGATVVPKSMSETRGFMGLKTLKLLHSITDATQMDAFLQRAIFIPIALTDAEITAILQGTQAGYEFPNLVPLFSDSKWVKHAEATPSADGKTLTLAATAGGKLSYVRIPVFSNTKYEFSFNHTTTDGWAWIDEKYGTITTKSFASTSTFTTSPNTTSVVLSLSNNAAGTIAFSNVSLKIKM